MIPINRASTNEWIAEPPKRKSAVSVSNTVSEVLIDRPIVCRMLWLTIWSNGSPACRTRFSRMRSNTTIVSCTENPMTVSMAVTNRASSWSPKNGAEDGEDAHDHDHVVDQRRDRRDAHAVVAEAEGDPEMIAIAPKAMSRMACWTSSALTTGPTLVSTSTSSIGPKRASRAVRSTASLPLSVSLPLPEVGEAAAAAAGTGDPEAAGLAEAEEPEALALATALGLATAGDADAAGETDAMPLAAADPEAAGEGVGQGGSV